MSPVQWPDATDDPIGGDLTAALAYVTPAGGAVVTAVAPIGLRDRNAGTVSFTTSLGFGRKLERIKRDPRVSLAYHAREHGRSRSNRYVLVQGRATVIPEPDRDYLDFIGRQATPFMGPPRRGALWDRWLSAYYSDRVPVHVQVERIVSWPNLRCEGEPEVHGAAWPDQPPAQEPPAKGTGPRLDSERAGRALAKFPHQLVAYRGADGHPVVVPVRVLGADAGAVLLSAAQGLLPPGGRRAGMLAHEYRPKLIGLAARLGQDLIWVGGGNTANMLAIWRLHGVDRALREAWEAGVVLAGSSAGMICWFEASITDSFGPQLAPLHDGLGFLAGSACPHYDGEDRRRPVYRDAVGDGFPAGYAADDGVALHFSGSELAECVTGRDGARAWRVEREGSDVVERALPTRLISG